MAELSLGFAGRQRQVLLAFSPASEHKPVRFSGETTADGRSPINEAEAGRQPGAGPPTAFPLPPGQGVL